MKIPLVPIEPLDENDPRRVFQSIEEAEEYAWSCFILPEGDELKLLPKLEELSIEDDDDDDY